MSRDIPLRTSRRPPEVPELGLRTSRKAANGLGRLRAGEASPHREARHGEGRRRPCGRRPSSRARPNGRALERYGQVPPAPMQSGSTSAASEHSESHSVLQQYASAAQIVVVHVASSQPGVPLGAQQSPP